MATKSKGPTEARREAGKRYKIDVRTIVENHNPRNPLSPSMAETYALFTGDSRDLWAMAVSEDPAARAAFVAAFQSGDPEFVSWAATFMTVGQLEPVEVRDNGAKGECGSTYTLVFGCRRCLAILFNWAMQGAKGTPWVEVQLSPKLNAAGLLHRSIVENVRRDPNPMERARAFQMLINQGLSVGEVADQHGICETTVRNALALLELPVETQKKVAAGSLRPSKALALKDRPEAAEGAKVTRLPKRVAEVLSPLKTRLIEGAGDEGAVTLTLTPEEAGRILDLLGD